MGGGAAMTPTTTEQTARYPDYGPLVPKIEPIGIVAKPRKRGRPRRVRLLDSTPADVSPDPLTPALNIRGGGVCDRQGGWALLSCRAGGCGAGVAVPLSCGRSSCPACRRQNASRRARRLMSSIGGPDLGVLTVTLPPSWHKALNRQRIKVIERSFWAAFVAYLGRYGVAYAGSRAYWHPCGDICRECGESTSDKPLSIGDIGYCSHCGAEGHIHPHVNYLVPLLGISAAGNPVKIPRKRALSAMNSALSAAQDALSAALNLPVEPIQTWWGFRVEEAQKRHSFAYFARPFPGYAGAMKEVYGPGSRLGLAADTRSERARLWRLSCRPGRPLTPLSHVCCPVCGCEGTLVVDGAYYGPVRVYAHGGGPLMMETLSKNQTYRRYRVMADIHLP